MGDESVSTGRRRRRAHDALVAENRTDSRTAGDMRNVAWTQLRSDTGHSFQLQSGHGVCKIHTVVGDVVD
jgi:hypothetical protein